MSWLRSQIGKYIHSMHSEGPHQGETGAYRHFHIVALDTPETDSYIKQLAVHVGELCNRRYIHVTKQSAAGIQPWRITNRHYDGGAAHPHAVEFQATSPGSGAWG